MLVGALFTYREPPSEVGVLVRAARAGWAWWWWRGASAAAGAASPSTPPSVSSTTDARLPGTDLFSAGQAGAIRACTQRCTGRDRRRAGDARGYGYSWTPSASVIMIASTGQ